LTIFGEKKSLNPRYGEIAAETRALVVQAGLSVKLNTAARAFIVNDVLRVSLYMPRYVRAPDGSMRWNARRRRNYRQDDLTLIVRLDERNQDILEYFLLPALDFPKRMRFSGETHKCLEPYHCNTFDAVLQALRKKLCTEIGPVGQRLAG
jgi:hypothetical protein